VQIAAALQAEKLILMTDVPGVMRDKNDIATKFTSLSISGVRELVADGTIAGGMIPKYALDQRKMIHPRGVTNGML
jgi:acetylglutamate kinase